MLYDFTILQFRKMLLNLSAFLQKGAAHAATKKVDFGVFLQFRLAPDQFPLVRQVQIACDTAKLCVARLTGKEAPTFPDNETSLPELLARIDRTIAYLDTFSPSDFEGAESRHASHPRWEGQYLTGVEFVREYAGPNFFFHVTTAYSILRHNGVDLGKKDYLGPLPLKR